MNKAEAIDWLVFRFIFCYRSRLVVLMNNKLNKEAIVCLSNGFFFFFFFVKKISMGEGDELFSIRVWKFFISKRVVKLWGWQWYVTGSMF